MLEGVVPCCLSFNLLQTMVIPFMIMSIIPEGSQGGLGGPLYYLLLGMRSTIAACNSPEILCYICIILAKLTTACPWMFHIKANQLPKQFRQDEK